MATTPHVYPLPTPAAEMQDSTLSQTEYCGVMATALYSSFEEEMAACLSGCVLHDLGWRRAVALKGEDQQRWLNGMVTNSVAEIGPGQGNYNFLLSAQGRVLADLLVWRRADGGLVLETTASQLPLVLSHLDHYIIMDDVELAEIEEQTALGLAGPAAAAVLSKLGVTSLPGPSTALAAEIENTPVLLTASADRGIPLLNLSTLPHYTVWIPKPSLQRVWQALLSAGATPAGVRVLEAVRILEGVPTYGVDITERELPQETAQSQALHFNKGCYLGQEIVERIRSRGAVHRHLRQLVLQGELPAPGTELFASTASVGTITSATEVFFGGETVKAALGVVKDQAVPDSTEFTYSGGTASFSQRPK